MKGLLLKDIYMTARYCRSYLLIIFVFTAVSLFSAEASAFLAYTCLITGLLPVTLMAYDERSKWTEYSGALPYGKGELVSAKYLIGILGQLSAIVLSLLITICVKGFAGVLANLSVYLFGFAATLVTVGLILPFMFRFGVEKGRIAYYILIAGVFAVTFAAASFSGENEASVPAENILPTLSAAAVAGAVALYAASWLVSIALYKKREAR